LVVRAQQRRAVARDERLADVSEERRLALGVEDGALGEREGAAVVVGVEAGADVRAGRVRRRVHVRHEADGGEAGGLLGGEGRGERGEDVAPGVHLHVVGAHRDELLDEETAQVLLLLGRGKRLAVRVRPGVEADVAAEAAGDGREAGDVVGVEAREGREGHGGGRNRKAAGIYWTPLPSAASHLEAPALRPPACPTPAPPAPTSAAPSSTRRATSSWRRATTSSRCARSAGPSGAAPRASTSTSTARTPSSTRSSTRG